MKRIQDQTIQLSVVVVFYNMRREARRTLLSLTSAYQHNIHDLPYEVIVVDSGSPQPLEKDWVESLGENFRYIYFEAHFPSPCAALNYGAQIAHGEYVMMCIDGARILSPGILHYSMLATRISPNPFIYTLGMHIGSKLQNYLVDEGYSQIDEDRLLASLDWENDGYSLFDISSLAASSGGGYFSPLNESNCVTLRRSTYLELGGFDEKFRSGGGGVANLDFFNRANAWDGISPIMLLGEATFHQFHGGTATSASLKKRYWEKMHIEYELLRGKRYQPCSVSPTFLGVVHPKSRRLLLPPEDGS